MVLLDLTSHCRELHFSHAKAELLSTKTVILSTCSCLRNHSKQLWFPKASRFIDDECGACLKSGSMSKYFPVRSVPTLNTRFKNRKLFKSDSKCSHVFCCVFGFKKTVDVFESIV